MKKLIWLVLLTCFISLANAQSQIEIAEALCGQRVSNDREKAQWGLQLRDDMLRQCKGQKLDVCGKPWVDLILKKEQGEISYVIEKTSQGSRPGVRTEVITGVKQSHTAALRALKSGQSPQQISNDLYMKCVAAKTSNDGGGFKPEYSNAKRK